MLECSLRVYLRVRPLVRTHRAPLPRCQPSPGRTQSARRHSYRVSIYSCLLSEQKHTFLVFRYRSCGLCSYLRECSFLKRLRVHILFSKLHPNPRTHCAAQFRARVWLYRRSTRRCNRRCTSRSARWTHSLRTSPPCATRTAHSVKRYSCLYTCTLYRVQYRDRCTSTLYLSFNANASPPHRHPTRAHSSASSLCRACCLFPSRHACSLLSFIILVGFAPIAHRLSLSPLPCCR